MKKIETKIYASVRWSNKSQYAGQRKAADVFKDIYRELGLRKMLPDGYLKTSRKIEQDPEIEFPEEMLEVIYQISRWHDGSYLKLGIYCCAREEERCKLMPFMVGKVMDRTGKGYERMEEIAGCIYALLMGYREGHMTFRQAMRKIHMPFETLLHPTDAYGNWPINIEFHNSDGEHDCTQFDVRSSNLDYINGKCKELEELWKDFCRENGFHQNSIIQISLVFPQDS